MATAITTTQLLIVGVSTVTVTAISIGVWQVIAGNTPTTTTAVPVAPGPVAPGPVAPGPVAPGPDQPIPTPIQPVPTKTVVAKKEKEGGANLIVVVVAFILVVLFFLFISGFFAAFGREIPTEHYFANGGISLGGFDAGRTRGTQGGTDWNAKMRHEVTSGFTRE